MSGNALDKMDEFFDFAALEHDSALHATKPSHQQQNLPSQPAANVTTMDWATVPIATTRSMDATQRWDDPMDVAPQDPSISQAGQQWPLFSVPEWSPPVNVNPTLDSTGDSVHGENPGPAFASLSPIDVPYPDLHRANDDSLPSTSQSEPPSWDSRSAAQANPPEVAVLPVSPTASIQQTPNASRKPASAKRKGTQSRIPIEAKQILEDEFATNAYPCSWEMDIIAHQANLDVKKVRNWFNNTRARKKCEGA